MREVSTTCCNLQATVQFKGNRLPSCLSWRIQTLVCNVGVWFWETQIRMSCTQWLLDFTGMRSEKWFSSLWINFPCPKMYHKSKVIHSVLQRISCSIFPLSKKCIMNHKWSTVFFHTSAAAFSDQLASRCSLADMSTVGTDHIKKEEDDHPVPSWHYIIAWFFICPHFSWIKPFQIARLCLRKMTSVLIPRRVPYRKGWQQRWKRCKDG